MLPFTLGPVTIVSAGPASRYDRLYVIATCKVCGATSTSEIYESEGALIHCANGVARYLCPERGHGHYGYA